MKSGLPLISVVIPTYNSEKKLKNLLKSLKDQDYPRECVEIIVIDGGSSDNTRAVAKRYGCKIYENPRKLQVFAKQIGYIKSKGKYVIHFDSDEIVKNKKSLRLKVETFRKRKDVHMVISSGLQTPSGVSSLNHIVNEFGDPFTYFMYKNETSYGFLEKRMKKFGKVVLEDENSIILKFDSSRLPYFELSTMGSAVDKSFVDKNFPSIKQKPHLVSHMFYLLTKRGSKVGFVKNDPVVHYSVKSFSGYLTKIRSRVINNVFNTEMGRSAFSGVIKYFPKWYGYKKFLFVFYSVSLLLPLVDGINLTVTRRKMIFLIYPFLNLYIVFFTIYYSLLKILRFSPNYNRWGE